MTDQIDTKEPAAVPAPAAPVYEPERLYDVKLSRPVMLFGVMHSPMHDNWIQGQYIAELGDAVASATAL